MLFDCFFFSYTKFAEEHEYTLALFLVQRNNMKHIFLFLQFFPQPS